MAPCCTLCLLRSAGCPAQNPERVVEGYTEEFEASFLELLRQSHPFSRVAAKVVYNDYIANKCAPLISRS
jgi:hypothetical protein